MTPLLTCTALATSTFLGWGAIPLHEDPTSIRRQAPPDIFDITWWIPLVKVGFMEFRPLETASPAVDVDTGQIVVTTRDGYVRALLDGHVQWAKKTPNRFYAGATIQNSVAYVAGGDGVLYALHMHSGDEVWKFDTKEELVTMPVIAQGTVLVTSQADTVFAVAEDTGLWKWQYHRDLPPGFTIRGAARPVIAHGMVYSGFADGTVVALHLDDGSVRWERTISTGTKFIDVDTEPIVTPDGRLIIASYQAGVMSLNAQTGDLEWVTHKPGITSIVLDDRTLFCAGDGNLIALEVETGSLRWTAHLSDGTSKGVNAGVSLTVAKGYVVVPTTTSLAFVDVLSGQVLTLWNPGRGVTAAPTAFHRQQLYVLSNLGAVFALRLNGG